VRNRLAESLNASRDEIDVSLENLVRLGLLQEIHKVDAVLSMHLDVSTCAPSKNNMPRPLGTTFADLVGKLTVLQSAAGSVAIPCTGSLTSTAATARSSNGLRS
jgi:hypothetical protein